MTGAKSRWADNGADESRRREKEEKKRAKAEKQKRVDTEAAARKEQRSQTSAAPQDEVDDNRPSKRRRLSNEDVLVSKFQEQHHESENGVPLLRFPARGWGPARNVDNFERLNHIEEGSYGWVSRARDFTTGEIVALKKLKMDNVGEGFPVTALREIQALRIARHRHIVNLIEVVVGNGPSDVYLVMDFIEHDLKTLQEEMSEPFLLSEVKTLLIQITSGIQFLHDNWILHRDLKTSNILMNNKGEIKIADFGMARQFSYPLPHNLTQLVVTLWYRAPELLLGTDIYGSEIDIWSIGCVFGELLKNQPLLQGRNEADQLSKIFSLVGTPTEQSWPGFRRLPNARALRISPNKSGGTGAAHLRPQFPLLTAGGVDLLAVLLSLNPDDRPSAEDVLTHPFFAETPRPKPTAMFPTFPSKAGGERRRRVASPSAPKRGDAPKIDVNEFTGLFSSAESEEKGGGFSLKLG